MADLRRRRVRRRPRRAARASTARTGEIATVTAVRPPARFGGLVFDGDRVAEFTEKPQIGEGWINGGFFVFEPGALRLPRRRRRRASRPTRSSGWREDGQLAAYRHDGFWQCMDTLRDKRLLDELWEAGEAPWKVWR